MVGATDVEEAALRALGKEAGVKVINWPKSPVGHGHSAQVLVRASSKWFKDAPLSVWVKRFQTAARKLARVDAFLKRFKLPLKQMTGYGPIPKDGNVEFEIITGRGYGGTETGTSLYPGRSDKKFRIYSD